MPEVVINKINGYYTDNEYHLISENDAIALCVNAGSIIFKPSIGTFGGHSIKKLDECTAESVKKVFNEYRGLPFIVQKILKQHDRLSAIHASSVNTIRIMTLLINNEIHDLKPVLRMGVNNSFVDNASSGGLVCGIQPDGRLKPFAFTLKGIKHEAHPQGYRFEDCVVPSMEKAIAMVKRQAERFPDFRLIAWDVAINEAAEPVLIEVNLMKGGLDIIQFNHGPLFGDLTDEILSEILKNNSKRK
jgi:hypothetical protein